MTRTQRATGQAKSSALRSRTRRILAQAKLGNRLKHRRVLEVKVSQQVVATAAGCTQGYYAELEAGTRSSDDVRIWLKIAEQLQLPRRRFLTDVWEARGSLPLSLPPTGTREREALLDLAIKQAGVGEPLPGLE